MEICGFSGRNRGALDFSMGRGALRKSGVRKAEKFLWDQGHGWTCHRHKGQHVGDISINVYEFIYRLPIFRYLSTRGALNSVEMSDGSGVRGCGCGCAIGISFRSNLWAGSFPKTASKSLKGWQFSVEESE
jgi:hypothetical protein